MNEFFSLNYRLLVRRLLSRLGCRETAADLAQESFLRVLKAEGTRIDNREAFLFRTATNLCTDHLRRRAFESKVWVQVDDCQDLLEDPSEECRMQGLETLERLEQALDKLPRRSRDIFIWNRLEGIPQREIAARLGVSINTVERHMIKAMLHCRQHLDAEDG